METRANYAAIGLFTLIVVSLAFGFIYWIKRFDQTGEQVGMAMEFSGTVNGLAPGADIFFNGIKVGSVSRLSFSTRDPNIVEVGALIKKSTPIKNDSHARVSVNLLTGVAYVELFGGTPGGSDILASANPKLVGDPPAGDFLPALGRAASKIDATMDRVNAFLDDATPSVKRSIGNVESFTKALADNAGGVKDALASIQGLSARLEGVADRVNAIVAAVEPAKVRATVDNVDKVMKDAAKFSGRGLDELTLAISDFRRAVSQIDRIGQSLERNPQQLILGGEGNVREFNRR